MKRSLVGSMLAVSLLLPLLAVGCSHEVALRPAKTCDGGNVDKCREACDQNEGRACYRLGWFYEQGLGVSSNEKKAIDLYERSCQANWAVACRALGLIYWRGDGVKRSRKRAIEYYQKACTLGIAEACPTEAMIAEAQGKKRGSSPGVGVSVDAEASAGQK